MKEGLKNIDWRIIVITVVMAIVTAGAIGFGVWYYMDQQNQKTADDNAKQVESLQKQITKLEKTVTPTPTPTPAMDPTVGWKTYTSNKLGISFKYPNETRVIDCTSSDDTLSQFLWLSDINSNDTCNNPGSDKYLGINGFIEKSTLELNYQTFGKFDSYSKKDVTVAKKNSIQVTYNQDKKDFQGNNLSPKQTISRLETDIPMSGTKYATFTNAYLSKSDDQSLVEKSYVDTYNSILSSIVFL